MVLYATGFNAWRQLHFETSVGDGEPDDIPSFTRVLRDEALSNVRPFFSYTRVTSKDGNYRVAGMIPKDHEKLRAVSEQADTSFVQASNGVVVALDGEALYQYSSIRDLISGNISHRFSCCPNVTQLVAYETGFAALSSTGQVWSWGDERYAACLGREPTDDSPADRPSRVTDLDDLPTGPITKLAAGGYVLAALTAGNDLYCWGHAGRSPILKDLSDTAEPIVINDKDVIDVAVGDAHMLALTSDRQVYVVGDNTNCQLGLPGVSSASEWRAIDLESVLPAGQVVTGVAAGPKSSFLIVGNQPG